jgi:glucose-1-phosphate adenylyltransferase
MKSGLAIILAGGRGSRLAPLTNDRAKPAVPFGGVYRIIDFALSNCLNSGLRRMLLLTQYKGMSLDRHINVAWKPFFCRELGEFIDVVPPQQRIDEQWYQGTADAVYQNIYHIEQQRPERVVILAGDHIYKMDYSRMVKFHLERHADVTIGALPVKKEEAHQFGVMQIDTDQRVIGFQEKPSQPATMPHDADRCLVSMGIYVFETDVLFEMLCRDAARVDSRHDFGRDVIPAMLGNHNVFAFPFRDENRKQDAYWRDVGTLDAYYEANMDLVSVDPQLNLYDEQWPIRSYHPNHPPPKFVFSGGDDPRRCGRAINSTVGQGSIISGGLVEHCIVGRNVRVNSYAHVMDSIVFDDVTIGRNAKINRAIIDKRIHIPPDTQLGHDHELDRARGFHVTESGVVVVSTSDAFPPEEPAEQQHKTVPTGTP